MARFTCPKCQTIVEAQQGQSPVCPNCGYGSPPLPGPSPAAPSNPACPRCGSTSFSMDKQGYGWGKGATGFCCCGPLGAFLGGAGSKRAVRVCNNCGNRVKL